MSATQVRFDVGAADNLSRQLAAPADKLGWMAWFRQQQCDRNLNAPAVLTSPARP